MKTKKIFSAAACIALSIFAVSCSNDDIVLSTNEGTTFIGSNMDESSVTRATLSEDGAFASNLTELTRTFVTYKLSDAAIDTPIAFNWEEGDRVYVKDATGVWQKSTNSVENFARGLAFSFNVKGAFSKDAEYEVIYNGSPSITADKVTIPTTQEMADDKAQNTKYFSTNGDCGFAKATKQTDGTYRFVLDHKSAYLHFFPYSTPGSVASQYYKITSIEVTSDNNIAGTYTLSETGLDVTNGTGTSKTITLKTGQSGVELFWLGEKPKNTCLIFMMVAPGTHKLSVKYTFVSTDGKNTTKTLTKSYKQMDLKANGFYNIPVEVVL